MRNSKMFSELMVEGTEESEAIAILAEARANGPLPPAFAEDIGVKRELLAMVGRKSRFHVLKAQILKKRGNCHLPLGPSEEPP